MKKRVLAGLLVLCLIVGLVPTVALAVEDTADSVPDYEAFAAHDESWNATTGECVVTVEVGESLEGAVKRVIGDNYARESIKSLVISTAADLELSASEFVECGENTPQPGNTAATDKRQTTADFTYMRDELPNLEKVDMSGVTMEDDKIPDNAFRCKTTLTEFVFPEDIQYTGNNSFAYSGLEGNIIIPASLVSLSNLAFGYCTDITGVEFGEGSQLTDVSTAFYGCTSLSGRIDLPDTVTSIGYGAFRNTQITGINLPSALTAMEYYVFAGCKALTGTFTIPDAITEIPIGLFQGAGLTEIVIHDRVTAIGDAAFSDLPAESKLVFTGSNEAAVNSLNSNNYTAANTGVVFDGVTYKYSNGAYTVAVCDTNRTSVKILGTIAQVPVTSIAASAFSGCVSLTEVDMVAANKITNIGSDAFSDLPMNSTILVASSTMKDLFTSDNYTSTKTELKLGEGFIYSWNGSSYTVCGYAGEIPSALKIPDTYLDQPVTAVSNSAFAGEQKVTSVSFASGIQTIGNNAFDGCTALTSVTFAEGSSLATIGQYAFQQTGLTGITLPEGLKKIEQYAFYKCESLASVTIPASVTNIGNLAFAMDNTSNGGKTSSGALETVTFASGSQLTSLGSGVFRNTKITSIELPDGLKSISNVVFYGCDQLGTIQFPSSVTSIGSQSFSGCPISALELPDGLVSIGGNAFDNNNQLKTLKIPASVSSLGSGVFASNTSLTSVEFEEGTALTDIVQYAFSGCTALESIELPSGITSIGNRALYNCNSLNGLYIPASVTSVGRNGSLFTAKVNFVIYLSETQKQLLIGGTSVGSEVNYNNSKTALAVLNGGEVQSGTTFSGSTLTTKLVKDGCVFAGWYTDKGLSTEATKTDGDEYTAAAGTTYYAKWTESSYSVDRSLAFDALTYGNTPVSKTLTVTAAGVEDATISSVASSNSFTATTSASGLTITVTPKENLSVGTYNETIVVTTGDGATHNVAVTLTVTKAGSTVESGDDNNEPITATYGDTITLTAKVQRAETGIAMLTALDEVDFIYGDIVLGSVKVTWTNDIGAATLTYDTSTGDIPVGQTAYITAQYGGNGSLNAGTGTNVIVVALSPKPLTITGLTATDRAYDGTTAVALSGGMLSGIVGNDDVSATVPTSGTVDSDTVGNGKSVTVGDISLTGKDADKYTVTAPTDLTVNITQATLAAPKLTNYTATTTSITVTAPTLPTGASKVLYSINNGTDWQDSNVFSGLASGASYSVTAKFVADDSDNYTDSEQSGALSVKTDSFGGGSSSFGSTTYTVAANSAKNGTISVSPKNASKGTTVTITVKPNSGYELDDLTATDKNGDAVKLTRKSDTQYTFTMPASKVTVEAGFTKIEEQPKVSFVDVSTSAYYYDAVEWAVENGVTSGTTATTFSPDAACTRAQAVTFLWRAAGSPAPNGAANPFTDVDSGAYYYDAILWAVEQGITAGTSATTFSPNATCTRGQTVTFLYRYAGSPAVSGGSFADVASDAYYANAVAWAVSDGITNGTGDNQFSPDASCTRAQIVTFLYRDLAE